MEPQMRTLCCRKVFQEGEMNDEQETPTLWRHMLQLPIIISSRRNGQVVAQEVLRLFARESELVMQLAQLAGSDRSRG